MPYQDAPSPPMTEARAAACQRAVHVLLPDGTWLRAGRAALYLLRESGMPKWMYWLAGLPPFIWCIELGYYLIARFRGKLYRYVFRRFDPLRDLPMGEPF